MATAFDDDCLMIGNHTAHYRTGAWRCQQYTINNELLGENRDETGITHMGRDSLRVVSIQSAILLLSIFT